MWTVERAQMPKIWLQIGDRNVLSRNIPRQDMSRYITVTYLRVKAAKKIARRTIILVIVCFLPRPREGAEHEYGICRALPTSISYGYRRFSGMTATAFSSSAASKEVCLTANGIRHVQDLRQGYHGFRHGVATACGFAHVTFLIRVLKVTSRQAARG